jgi:hypothetical protein
VPGDDEQPTTDLVGEPLWQAAVQQITTSADPHEQLAIAAWLLRELHAGVRAELWADWMGRIRRLRAEDPSPVPALADLDASSGNDDELGARALVRLVVRLDADLHRADRPQPEFGAVPDPVVSWGPFPRPGSKAQMLHLIVRQRSGDLPADDPVDVEDEGIPPDERNSVVAAACPHHRVLLTEAGLAWEPRILEQDLLPQTRVALGGNLHRTAEELRVAIWAGTPFDHALNASQAGSCAVVGPLDAEKAVVLDDVEAAVTYAAKKGAHVLVLPELYVAAEDEQDLADRVLRRSKGGFPALVYVGLSHQARSDAEPRWTNELVVMACDGTVAWRQHKLSPVVLPDEVQECLGSDRTVRLRWAGDAWLVGMICRDLFDDVTNGALHQATPNFVGVPSLSPKTGPHQDAASGLRPHGCVVAVANRPYGGSYKTAPSLYSALRHPPTQIKRKQRVVP